MIQKDTKILYSRWIRSFSHQLFVPHPKNHICQQFFESFKGNKNYRALKPQITQLKLFKTAKNAASNGAPPKIPHGNIIQELEKSPGSFFWEGPHGIPHLPSSACLFSHLPLLKNHLSNLRETAQIKGAGILCITGREMNLFPYAKGEQNAKFHSKAVPAQLHLTSK